MFFRKYLYTVVTISLLQSSCLTIPTHKTGIQWETFWLWLWMSLSTRWWQCTFSNTITDPWLSVLEMRKVQKKPVITSNSILVDHWSEQCKKWQFFSLHVPKTMLRPSMLKTRKLGHNFCLLYFCFGPGWVQLLGSWSVKLLTIHFHFNNWFNCYLIIYCYNSNLSIRKKHEKTVNWHWLLHIVYMFGLLIVVKGQEVRSPRMCLVR